MKVVVLVVNPNYATWGESELGFGFRPNRTGRMLLTVDVGSVGVLVRVDVVLWLCIGVVCN